MAVLQGIQIPFMFSESGGVVTADPLLKIKNNIQTICSTLVGTRLMEPNYGSLIPAMLAEMNDDSTKALIEREILQKIGAQERNVQVLKVDISKSQSTVLVFVQYIVTTFDITDSVLLQI